MGAAKRHTPARVILGTLIQSQTIVRPEEIPRDGQTDEPSNDPNGTNSEEGIPIAHLARARNVALCATYTPP
jgi:hypothetical protein